MSNKKRKEILVFDNLTKIRNPFMVLALRRAAGTHERSSSAQRQQARKQITEELSEVSGKIAGPSAKFR